MRAVRVALLAGLTLLAVAIGLVLLHAPRSVAGSNRPPNRLAVPVASTDSGARYCQGGEVLPQGTTAIRIWLFATVGPSVRVAVYSDGRAITGGQRGSAWTAGSVTVALRPLPRTVSDATVCVSFALRGETIYVEGNTTPAASAARQGRRAVAGRVWIEYLRPGTRSWLSMASELARRMGLGRAAAGTWIVLLALALLAAAIVLATNLLAREMP